MNLDMRKPFGHLPHMRVKPVISTFVFPAQRDLARCVAEDGAELMLYSNLVAKFFIHGIDASLRRVCPDAQNIGEIGNLDRAHSTFSKHIYW